MEHSAEENPKPEQDRIDARRGEGAPMSRFLGILIALLLAYLCVIETVQVFGLYKAVEFAQQELAEE